MSWLYDFITLPELQPLWYLCFGVLLIAIMTLWCQKRLLRDQHKWQKLLAQEQRDAEKLEKENSDQEMRERIRQSFIHLSGFIKVF